MSTNSLIGGLIGGVAGFFIGGPAGAWAGAGIGMGLGAALTPMPGMSQQGPRLSDLKVQTSTYGASIARVYGTVGITGNVFWLEGNQLKEVVTRRKVKSGGKGGSKKTTVTTYTYYATLAIGLCEGPIAGVRRIWAGPTLIYDAASDDLETIIASNQAAENFTIYLGGGDQQPDSRIQADRGVDNTPAYRGLAYVVIKDFLLTDYGNAIPAFKFEVVQVPVAGIQAFTSDLPSPSYWCGIASDGLRVIAVSETGPTAAITRDYRTWQALSLPGGSHADIVHSGQVFCAISAGGASAVSADAASWEVGSIGGGSGWRALAHGAGTFCAITKNSNQSAVSGDGLEWTLGTLPATRAWVSICHGAGFFVAVAESAAVVAVSADGLSWEEHPLPLSSTWSDVIFTAGRFVIVARSSGAPLLSSADLLSWESIASPSPSDVWGCASAADGHFFAISAGSGGASRVAHSTDGVAWAAYEVPSESWGAAINSGAVCHAVAPGVLGMTAAVVSGGEAQSLADVIASECSSSGLLAPIDCDVSGIGSAVSGYRVASTGSIRSALEPLRAAFPFDAYQSGYLIRFRPRGQASVVTIGIDELGVDEQLPQAREMDGQLPARLSVNYLDAARNYDANEQFAERINTEAVNDSNIELPIVMTASQAAQAAERLLNVAWLERSSFGPFQLPPTYRNLEPTDVIVIDASYAQYELRLTEVSYNADGTLTCAGAPNSAAVYVSGATSDETPSQQVIGLRGESLFVPLDIPVIDETIQNSPGFVGAMTGYTAGWPGAVVVQSADGGQTWAEIQAYDGKASVGTARGALAVNSGALLDQSPLIVDLLGGALESVSEEQMLGGANWAAYGADGRWEIVRFRDAVLQIDGSYLLSGFKRGDRGTEWATGLHQAGDLFLPLDDGDLAAIGLPFESIGVANTWRGVTAGDSVDTAANVPFTYRGVNLRPLSPSYPVSSRNGGGDLALSWTRRSRLSSSWWATGTAAPLGEASEAYEVDILNGSTVVRTISSSTPSIAYTAAQQTADFGSAQASISVRIAQLSAVVGRGNQLEVTV